MARLAIPLPVLGFLLAREANGFAKLEEADDSRRELDLLSLFVDLDDPRASLGTSGERARREMDRLSLSSETQPSADPRDELDLLSLTTRRF